MENYHVSFSSGWFCSILHKFSQAAFKCLSFGTQNVCGSNFIIVSAQSFLTCYSLLLRAENKVISNQYTESVINIQLICELSTWNKNAEEPGQCGRVRLCSGVHERCNHALLLVHSLGNPQLDSSTPEALLPAGSGIKQMHKFKRQLINFKDNTPRNTSGDAALFVDDLAALPAGVQNTDLVGATEPLWGDRAATHPVGHWQCPASCWNSKYLRWRPGDTPGMEWETWPCLLAAAAVQLTSFMLE